MTRYVIMGVAGSGKSSIGAALAQAIGGHYVDGDDLHPPENIAKMSRGDPLTDVDRGPWLDLVGARLAARSSEPLLIGCSALKKAYRDRIRAAVGGPVTFVHLTGPRAVIEGRMAARQGHFMPTALLDSQFATLEPPGPEEDAIAVSIDQPPEQIVVQVARKIDVRG